MGVFYEQWSVFSERGSKGIKEILLQQRNLLSSDDIQKFFSEEEIFYDPNLFKDYNKALTRIFQALEKQERVIVFGDYDVDGTVGTAILVSALEKIGIQVSYRIPHRKNDGYGLKKYFIDELKEKKVSLIITVDNGISAYEEVSYANTFGIDVIITDHHMPQGKLPEAYAIMNHKQEGCRYPFSEACGAMIAYKLALGLIKNSIPQEYEDFKDFFLDLVALATVTDCMPLIDENRSIVKQGLKRLKETYNPGIQALAASAGINLKNADTDMLGFQLGPRVNAAGRLSSAYLAVQLFLGTSDHADALNSLNEQRKSFVKQALEEIETSFSSFQFLILAHSSKWHTGIIGLIAGRLTEKHHLPSIILEDQGEKLVASCRAPEGFDMFAFLSEFSQYFIHFGGHKQAAGFSIEKEKLQDFSQLAQKKAQEILLKSPLEKKLDIVTELFPEDLNLNTFHLIEEFAPFGIGNKKPIFLLKNMSVEWKTMGKDQEHLQGFIQGPTFSIRLLRFYAGDLIQKISDGKSFDIACSLGKNIWNNNEELQLELIDVRKNA